jgi:hypothetical protein
MKNTLKTALAVITLTAALAACTATTDTGGVDKDAIPQAPSSSSAPAAPVESSSALAKPKASTCDVAREAILTGTPASLDKALKALQNDKTADATAREYARYYLVRDKGNKDLQEMDLSLISSACQL